MEDAATQSDLTFVNAKKDICILLTEDFALITMNAKMTMCVANMADVSTLKEATNASAIQDMSMKKRLALTLMSA